MRRVFNAKLNTSIKKNEVSTKKKPVADSSTAPHLVIAVFCTVSPRTTLISSACSLEQLIFYKESFQFVLLICKLALVGTAFSAGVLTTQHYH